MATKRKNGAKQKSSVSSTSRRQKLYYALAALGLGVILSLGAYPAETDVKLPVMMAEFTDKEATEALTLARKALPQMKGMDGHFLREETVEERALPILSVEAVKRALNTGVVSGLAQYCQMNWEDNYGGLMAYYRHQQGFSEKQLALIGFLHGFTMGQFLDGQGHDCSENNKAIFREHSF